ncbi:MAG: alkane 1-monooxygenase [Leptospira sp.]|nr:alkane 1-monooxygenase [Leptospira sp.]
MSSTKYLAGYIIPFLSFIAIYLRGYFLFIAPIFMFGVLPILELFFTGSVANLAPSEETRIQHSRIYDILLYFSVPVQFSLVFYASSIISSGHLNSMELFGVIVSVGMSCGVLGINVAHELGHRKKRFERIFAKMLLLTSLYMHFFIEHNKGHHQNVSTNQDPATARINENVYFFIVRSVIFSFISAWQIEARRLRAKNIRVYSVQNQIIQFIAIQAGFIYLIYLLFGGLAATSFCVSAAIGITLLEMVNYIEHYGLMRKETSVGRYEKMRPSHSWNSNHTLGRALLFELTRHSDHHSDATRKYQLLRHFSESPQLPTGYPGMMLLSLFPPLWYSVMNRTILDHISMDPRISDN